MKNKSMKDLDKLHETNPILNSNLSVEIPEPTVNRKLFLSKNLSPQTNPTALKRSKPALKIKKFKESDKSTSSDVVNVKDNGNKDNGKSSNKKYDNMSELKNVIINDISHDSDSNLIHHYNRHKKNKHNVKSTHNKGNHKNINNDIGINDTTVNSIKTISSETSRRQASETPWTAIDTLDDVKVLANQQSYETHFQDNFEEQLLKSRKNDIKLLLEMRERNLRLMKHDANVGNKTVGGKISFSSNEDSDDRSSSENDSDSSYWSVNETSSSPITSKGNTKLSKESKSTKTNETSTVADLHRGTPINSRHRASFQINLTDNAHVNDDEPLYVSDYVDNLRNIHHIAERERQYVENLEVIARERMRELNSYGI